MGPQGPKGAAEGCSPPQEPEKAGRRAAIFLVLIKVSRPQGFQKKIMTKFPEKLSSPTGPRGQPEGPNRWSQMLQLSAGARKGLQIKVCECTMLCKGCV